MSGSKVDHIADLAEEWLRQGGMQTMVLLAARRGRVVFHRAFGPLTPDPISPPTPLNALFDTQSIGKVHTATALMLLVDEGRVGLNRPVSVYLPEFRGDGKEAVLVRHLLTHTAGLREKDVEQYAEQQKGKVGIPPAEGALHPLQNEYFALRYGCPLWKAPGLEMSYLPFGYELLGEIVRRVSGEPLDRFAQERLFGPLGMNDSSFCPIDLPADRRVRRTPEPGLEPDESDRAHESERLYYGSGGVISSAWDLAILGQMFLNGGAYGKKRILSPETVRAMTRNQIPGIGATIFREVFPEGSWGFGWSVHGAKTGLCGGLYSPKAYEHSGRGGVYVWVDPEYEIVGVYCSATPLSEDTIVNWHRYWRNDLFTDALTAAVEEP